MDVTLWTTVCGSVSGMDWLTGLGEVWSSLFGENEKKKENENRHGGGEGSCEATDQKTYRLSNINLIF